jgi:hypothetical protein
MSGDATMYPYYNYCSEETTLAVVGRHRGVQSLYPPAAQPPNTAPTTTISSPANGTA